MKHSILALACGAALNVSSEAVCSPKLEVLSVGVDTIFVDFLLEDLPENLCTVLETSSGGVSNPSTVFKYWQPVENLSPPIGMQIGLSPFSIFEVVPVNLNSNDIYQVRIPVETLVVQEPLEVEIYFRGFECDSDDFGRIEIGELNTLTGIPIFVEEGFFEFRSGVIAIKY